MSLVQFHRLLIACGILFCGGYAWWEVRAFTRTGATSSLLLGVVFGTLALGLVVYLWRLRTWLGHDRE